MFDEKSRYVGLPTKQLTLPDGRTVAYVSRRLLPPPEAYVTAGGVTVTDSDRVDHLANRHLGAPAAYYQIADANEAIHPEELTETPGRRVRIPLPLATGSGR
jgi:hypothetical protein